MSEIVTVFHVYRREARSVLLLSFSDTSRQPGVDMMTPDSDYVVNWGYHFGPTVKLFGC